jgi:hypothetical protein
MGLFDKAFDGIVGSVLGGGLSFLGGERANDSSARSVERQLEFQRESYQNRYQWQMEDMKKAGLNPMLAYQQGAGPALSGSSYQAKDTISPGVNSALAARRLATELDVMESTAAKNKADTAAANAETIKKGAETFLVDQESANKRVLHDILRSQATSADAAARANDITGDFLEKYPLIRQLDIIGKALNPFASPVNSARSLRKDQASGKLSKPKPASRSRR